jgi:secreted trypsin-like serine protease
MKKVLALCATIGTALAFGGSALAQTGDAVPDGTAHPYVGALLRARTDGSLTITCSGTLVSPRVFLTAGHCSDYLFSLGQTGAYVTFDPNFGTDTTRGYKVYSTQYHGTVIENPDWHQPYQNDTAIILLDKAVKGITPQKIAPLGLLNQLWKAGTLQTSSFLNVGYGTAEQLVVPGTGPTFPFDGIRKYTFSAFLALDPEFIHLNQNLAQGNSGTGYGDSGGPTFLTTSSGTYVISVVSTGDVPCYATSVNERVDTQNAHDFLDPYLALR